MIRKLAAFGTVAGMGFVLGVLWIRGPILFQKPLPSTAFERGNYERSVEAYLALYEEGDKEAGYRAATIIEYGDFDREAADALVLSIYQDVATHGLSKAFFRLATLHVLGRGTPANEERGRQYLLQSLNHGDGQAALALTTERITGLPLRIKYEEAVADLLVSASGGEIEAERTLCELASNSFQVDFDHLSYCRLALQKGDLPSQQRLSSMLDAECIDQDNNISSALRERLSPDVMEKLQAFSQDNDLSCHQDTFFGATVTSFEPLFHGRPAPKALPSNQVEL